MKRTLFVVLMGLLCACSDKYAPNEELVVTANEAPQAPIWLGTWSTAQQLVEPKNKPPLPGLSHNTLRQIFKVSVGGQSIRMRFSNEFSQAPITLKAVSLAHAIGADVINQQTQQALTFANKPSVTIPAGGFVYSDELAFSVPALSTLTVTLHFGKTPKNITGHPGSRTTSYLAAGDQVQRASLSGAVPTDHWYVISGLEVRAGPGYGAIAIMGDSITDGRGSGTNLQNRWPDELAKRLQSSEQHKHIAVLNMGIGGGCLTRECIGPVGLDRINRDVFGQGAVRWLVVFIGVNDIGKSGTPKLASAVIAGYERVIEQAHAKGIKVYGATLTPSLGSGYSAPGSQAAKAVVNHWVRHSGRFDGVIDMDSVVRDPATPSKFLPHLHDNDWLHPNQAGYKAMAAVIDLSLFDE